MGWIKKQKINIHDCVMDRLNSMGASDEQCAHLGLFGDDAVYMGILKDTVIIGIAVNKNGLAIVDGKKCCMVYTLEIDKSILNSGMSHDLLDLIETIRVNARKYGNMSGHTFDMLSDIFNADSALCLVPKNTNIMRVKSGNILVLDIVPICHEECAQLMDKNEAERIKALEAAGISDLDRRVFGIDYRDNMYNIDTECKLYKESVLMLAEMKKELGDDFNGYIDLDDENVVAIFEKVRERLFGKGA